MSTVCQVIESSPTSASYLDGWSGPISRTWAFGVKNAFAYLSNRSQLLGCTVTILSTRREMSNGGEGEAAIDPAPPSASGWNRLGVRTERNPARRKVSRGFRLLKRNCPGAQLT